MEIECDLASIRDEDLLRKMWQQSEDFGRKKEIRSHLYKLRESRLREFYSTSGPGGDIIMNPATDMHFGKAPLTPSHGDSLVDQSFQSLKSKEVRDSLSPSREIKFRNSGGVAGGVLVPDTTGWDVQTSSEVSPDGRAFRTETLAKTDGVEKIPGGHSEFAGRNEQKSSASHQGDDENYVKKAAESSKTYLQEKVVIGDENSGRTEMKSSSVTSSSKVISSSSQQVISSGDPGFDMEPRRLTQDQQYQKELQAANNSTLHSERQQFTRNERNERNETSSNVREESKKYVDMDKASPEYQQHVQYLMSQPGAIISNTVEYPKPGVKMITTVKKLPDGTTVKTKRYETEAGADSTSISQTMKQQQQQQRVSSSTTSQKSTEKRSQDSEDVFTRLARTRDSNVPASPRNAPDTPSSEDAYSRLQQSRGVDERKFSDSIDQRSTQVLRDSNQHPGSRNAPGRRPSNLPENVEMISTTNKTVKKNLNQSVRSEKITSSDFIQNERDRYVLDHESPSRRGPDGYPDALAPITPSHQSRPQPDDYPSNGYPSSSEVIKQSSTSKTSAKFSESRRFSTETVESYQHSENENQDYTTRGYPSNRKPIEEPKGRSPSSGRPTQDFSTHGFPSVRSDKPTQQYSSDRPSTQDQDEYNTSERVHIIHTDGPRPGDANHPDSTTTTRSNYSTNETRRHVTSTKEDFSTHGFPSVRAGTPTGDSPRRPFGSDPTPGESPRRPSGQEPPVHQARKPPSDGFSTHGFPSVKSGSPTEDSPRRPSGLEPTNQGRRPTTGRSTPTHSAPQYESSPRVDRDDTASVTSDRSNSITYEKRIDAAHQAFARSLRCASPVESVRRDSTSDRHTPRSSVGSIRNTYSPSKRDGRSPSHDSITNSESSRISSGTVTKSHKPTEVRRVSSPKSPIGKSAPSHVSNETIDLSLTRKITAKPSPEKTSGRPTTVKEEPSASAEPILRKKIFGATENFLASEAVIEKPILKKEKYYQLGLSDATLPSSHSKARHQLGTTPNTSRRPFDTEEEVNTLLDTATKHITTHPSSVTPTTRPAKNQDTKPTKPETLYSKKPINKPEGYITQSKANEINEKHNQTTNKHVSYPHYIPSAPKADRSPSDKPTTNNFSSPAPTTTTSTTPHNAPKSTKDKVKPSTTSPTTTKPFSSPSKVDNSTPRFTKTVKVENAINRDTTTKTRRQPKPDSESEPLPEPEDLDEGYVPDRKGTRKPNSQRPTSDDEGFEPDSPRAGSPTSDFEYRRPEQIQTYDEEDSLLKKTRQTDKKTVTNDFSITERDVNKPRQTGDEPKRPRDRKVGEQEKPEDSHLKHPKQDDRRPSYSDKTPSGPQHRSYPEDQEPKRPSRRPKDTDTEPTWSFDEPQQLSGPSVLPNERNHKPSPVVDEPGTKTGPNEPKRPERHNRVPSYPKEPITSDDDKPSKTTDSTPRPRGTKPPLERSETFDERCRQILGMESETVVDRTKKTQDFIETERTTVDSKRKPSRRSPSPDKKQPSDTVSIEDCDDDDSDAPRKYPTGKTSTTTTHDYPREKSPSKKGPDSRPEDENTNNYPRDRSPVSKVPKGTRPNEFDETTTGNTTTKTTDHRATSPNRKTPSETTPSQFDHTRPRDHSPSEKPGWVDQTSTIRRKTKTVDESDERSTRSKPGSRQRNQSPQGTRPRTRSPAEDSDNHLTSARPRSESPSEKRTSITTREATFEIDSSRDKSPSKKPVHGVSPVDESPRDESPTKKSVRGASPADETPGDRSLSKKPIRRTSPTHQYPRDRSPSKKQIRETSPTDDTPRDKSPLKKPIRGTSPTDESSYRSPSKKPLRGTSPTDQYPLDRSPSKKQVGEISSTDESPRDKSPLKKPVRGTSPTDTTISSPTTMHSNITDGIIEDRYPSYTPKSYPRDRSPSDIEKIKPRTITDESPRDKSPFQKSVSGTSPTYESPRDKAASTKPVREKTSPTNQYPRDRSPSKKPLHGTSPTDESPRDKSPLKKPVRGTTPMDETTISSTTEIHSTITDGIIEDRYSSNTSKSYPRDRSPSDKNKFKPRTMTDESPRDISSPQKPVGASPTDESPRDKAPSRKPGRGTSPTNEYPRDRTSSRNPVRETSPTDESPRDKAPSRKPAPGTSPTDETFTSSTTNMHSTITDSINEDRYPSYTPKSYPGDRSPSEAQKFRQPTTEEEDESPRDKAPSRKPVRGTSPTDESPRDKAPSRKPVCGTSPTDESPRDKAPSRKPAPGTSPIDETFTSSTKTMHSTITDGINEDRYPSYTPKSYPGDRSPSEAQKLRPRTTEEEDESPRDKAPSRKPDRGTSPTDESPRDKAPSRKPVRGTSPTDESPRDKAPSRKPVRETSPTDETLTSSTTTMHSTITDGITEDRYPSYNPKSYPRDRSPSEAQKPRPRTTEEEELLIKTTRSTKKISAEEIIDDVFEVTHPRERSPERKPYGSRPDTSDGSFLSHPRDQSPSETVGHPVSDNSPSLRPKDYPRDRSPEKPTTKETEESITKRTTKTLKEKTIHSENTDRTPSSRPREYPRDLSPNEKFYRPVTEETDEYKRTAKTSRNTTVDKEIFDLTSSSHPRGYPRDRSPVDDLTHPSTKEITETHRTDKKMVINEFLDTERGIDRPHRPKDDKPINEQTPERLTSSRPRDYPNNEAPSQMPKRPTSDESTITKTTKTSRDTIVRNEIDEQVPSSRPRDRSPNEKPIRSPRIVTTETTTEYGIRERPRSRSPSEKNKKPVDFEEIDETFVQKITKITDDTTTSSDLVVDVEKPSRPTRPTRTEDQPKVKSPEKPKDTRPSHPTKESPRDRSPLGKTMQSSRPSDRSPSPRSKNPKQQGPTPGDTSPRKRSPDGKEKRPTGSPRQSSPSQKPRNYQLTDEETKVAQKLKSTKVTSSKDIIEAEFEDRPRDRSPSEKPRGLRPIPRGISPTKKPDDQEPTDSEYEETVTIKTDKLTRNEKTLEEKAPQSPKSYPREKSPSSKPRGPMPTEDTVVTTTVIEERFPKGQRGTSPSDKPNSRDYPRDSSPTERPRKPKQSGETSPSEQPGPGVRPRERSPTDRPRKQELNEKIVVEKTSIKTTTEERLPKSPRQTSPSGKPKESPRDRSPTDKPRKPIEDRMPTGPRRALPEEKPDESFVHKTTRGRKTVKETDQFVDECCQEHHPHEKSPPRKPKGSKPTAEIVVQRKVKTATVDDRLSKTPRGTSPTKTSPRERSPTQKPTTVYSPSPKESPRKTSPSEKPKRHQPVVKEFEKTSKLNKDRMTSEKIIVQDSLRKKSPSEKPKRRPSSDEETDDETTETIIAVYTIDGETVKVQPRDLSPSGTSKSYPKKPSEDSPKRPQLNGPERPRGTSPSEKPERREPIGEDVEETFTQRSSKIVKQKRTLEEIEIEDEVIKNRSQRGRYPEASPGDRPRDLSPSERPSPRSYPRDISPQKPSDEFINETIVITKTRKTPFDDQHRPSETLRGPQTTEDTILFTTKMTKKIEDHPRDRSPTVKPRDRSPAEKPSTRSYPRDMSPSDKQNRQRPGKVEETTNRNTTNRKIVQETDFEKRYPKSRPGDQSPSDKPSTLRRPSKISTTSTTTTRNRSTLDEEDINRTQRPKTQPSTRDKIPTKTTPLSSPRTQPTIERRVPAELPSPGKKPKSTFGVTTKTTTVTRAQTSRPKPTMEVPKKPSKLPLESRPTARATERKLSPSISPDSSPSRPASEVEVESPYRSPNMSPSRKSPSPTRSVKLEDITSTVSDTKKTITVTIDKSKPKTTHVTTAKFQITPPESPTKSSPSSKKPSSKVPTSKPIGSRLTTDTTTTKKVTSAYKDVPTDSERDSEIPSDAEEVDTPLPQKPLTRKLPVTERKESAPVHRVTKVNKDIQMSRSTSENIIKTPISKRPVKHEPLEPITQREATRPTVGDRSSPKTERRPSKHLSTKTINLTTFDKVINSQDMENVVIDIQHAKSSREQSPNKIVPTPVSVDVYTGKPRYPDVVQEPEDEPKRKPNVKNIPIFEEDTNDFVGCQITEINEDSHDHNTIRTRTTKYIERESSPQRRTPRIITGDNVDNECLLSVHDKVSKFITTAEEVSKPKTSAPFRRDVPEEDMPEDDECLLTVDEKVSKFLKTADSVTKEVLTSKPRRVERPSIEDLDEDLRTDECVLSVSEKVNKFTTKAEKLAPSAPQRSPELVARIERQISRQSDVESESPECEDSPASIRKFKPTSPLLEKNETKYTERQIDILSRPSVWDKKPKPDVKLDDIFGYKPADEPEPVQGVPKRVAPTKTHPDVGKSKPNKPTDSVSKRKELFENKVSTSKNTVITKRNSPESLPSGPTKSPLRRPSDESDSRYPNEFTPRYVDGYSHHETDDDVHEDVYGSSKTRRIHETSSQETTAIHHSSERSPTRKSSHPEIRPLTQTSNKSPRQPEENTPARRYSEDHSPRYTRDQPHSDRYMATRENSEHTTRRRSSTQDYPERRTPNNGSLSPRRKQPVEEPEDYTFSSRRDETNRHSTTRTAPRSPKDSPLNPTSFPDDEDLDHSPARSTSTVSSHRQTTHRTTSTRLSEDITSRRTRRPSGNEPSTPTTGGRTPRARAVPETVAARRNIFEKSPGDISPMPSNRRPSYMEPTKSSLEHRKDSIEITKTNFSRKSSIDEEPYEPSPKASVKFGVGLKHKEEPKPKRKLSSSDIPNIEDVFELELLEEMLNIVTLYEQRRRIRAQIRVVKKLLETKTKEEVSRMTKISTIRKTSSSFVKESPTPRKETPMRPERYQPSDDIDSESIVESRHIEEHEEIIRERSISPKSKTSRIVTKVTETRKIGEPTTPKRTPQKKDEPKDSKPIWATKNILKKPSENEKVARALSAKKTTSTSSSSMSRTQQTHHQRVTTDDDCVTSSYGIGPTDEDGRPLFGIRALKKKTTTNSTAQPSETTKVTGTVITEKYYSENGAEPVGERKVTVYSTNPEDLVDMETQYDRRDSETVKREKLSKDGVTTVTKVQKIGKYKPGEIPSLTDDAEFTKTTSKMVRRGSVKEMSEKFIRKESSSSVTEKSSGYPKAGLILRTRTNSGATADTADQYEVRAKSTEYDYDSEDEVEIRTSRKHSKVVTESDDETEIRRKVNTRSFLNSGGSKVTGIDDVLDRMRNADNVVVDGDTLEDREARSLLNKFLGASVLMTGMESMIPQKELRRTTAGADNKQEVKTTRVTKTIKTGATGGSSSSPVARETFDIEEIWDEEILKQLLEKSTSYEERRSIRARLRQLMAEREACAELKAGSKAKLNETKVQTSKTSTKVADDESSGSEYEEIIEEYTASEDDNEDDKTTTLIAEKKKDDVKEENNTKKITEEIKKTTITKKEEPKSVETKNTIVVESTTVVEEEEAAPSSTEEKKLNAKQNEEDTNCNDDDGDSASVSDSKGESLLIPLLQGLLHKKMPQARSSSGSSSKIATISATTSNKNSNNLKSSLKANNTHFSSTSNSNNNNSLGDSGLSSEVSKNSSLGQKQSGSSLRVTAPQQIEDSGTESGEDLRLIAAGIRDSMQIEGIENHSDMSLINEVTNALNKLESSLKEGKDLALDNSKKSTLLALVERLQTGLTAPDKLSSAVGEQDFPDETSSPEADNHRSNRQRFAKRKNRNNRHTVGVSKEELADARRYIEEMVMIENLSNCTTPECNAATTPPEFFAIQKQQSAGAIVSSHEPKEASGGLFRPNQFVPNNLKHSTEAGSAHPEVQLRQKKGTPGPGQRQSTGDMDSMKVPNSESNNGKRPLSDSFDSYTAQSNRVTFSDSKPQNGNFVQEKNQYNRSYHSDDKPNNLGRLSPDSNRLNRFNNKKQLMKRANTIDIPKTHRYNPEFDTDSDFEDRNAMNSKGLRGTVQVTVKRKPRQVVPNFEPKTENDHKFLAFIQKQSTTTGLGWNSSKSVSNWTNKFGNIKNVFESSANVSNSKGPINSAPPTTSSAKNFWKKTEQQDPPKISTNVLTSALKAKELNEKRGEVVVPKPIHMNKFSHNPQSVFRPVDISPETIQMQFKPIPMERPANVVSSVSPTKAYNLVRRQALESPHYAQSSPTKSWIKKNTATNSPITLPWTVKPAENNVLKIAATKFESNSPVQRHQSFKQQEKRPSLPNAAYPYQYQDDGYSQSQQSYVSNSQPVSYAEYPPQPRIFRESSLTNPQAEPLILSPNKPAYSPHILQPFEYYNDDLNQNARQTDMTDDDIDDMESMTEYRVEAKVMGKPMSQQAVTVGKRTSHMSDDEVFGKDSRAAKSLLSVMKNIGNGNGDRRTKKVERKQAPLACKSPNGSAYIAPIVEPLFPEVTKFEANRDPEYVGKQPKQAQPTVGYQQNPVYVPLEDYQHKQPPVAPPRGRKVSQERKKGSAYVPQERPNVHQQPRRDAPSSLPVQAGPTSPPRYLYSSPSQTPDSTPSTAQIVNDGMYMQNVPAFRKPYSEPNTPSDYSASNEAYFNQYNQMQKSYQGPRTPVILPQIPLETSYTKVYDKPRDVSSFYQPPMEHPNSTIYNNLPPKVQQSAQPSMYGPSEYQQQSEIPKQNYQTPKAQQNPLPQGFAPQQVYQPRAELPPEYYQSPKVQQSPQPLASTPQQAYQPRVDIPPEYYQSPKPHQQAQEMRNEPINQSQVPVTFYESPQIQPSAQPPMYAPQYTESPIKYNQSPKVLQSPRSDNSAPYFQPPKIQQIPQPSDIPLQYQQQSPKIPPTQSQPFATHQLYKSPVVQQSSEIPLQYQPQSQKTPQMQSQPLAPQQIYKSAAIQQSPQGQAAPSHKYESQQSMNQSYQSSKTQESPKPMSPPYKPKAPLIQSKPQVPTKNESVIQSSKSQHSSSTYRQQQMQSIIASTRTEEQQVPNAAVLCKQASLEGRKRVQSQSQKYEEVEEIRRKSLGNVLEVTRVEREAREQRAAAIKQDMYSVQQDVYSQQKSMHQKTEVHQQENKVVYKSSAPDDTPDIVKSSLKKDDIPILKKFGPPQRHCYIPNAYQNPLTKSETTVMTPKTVSRKFSDPAVTRGPVIVEIPSTPQPDSQDEIPRNIVFNNVSAFTSMSRRQGETSMEYTSQQSRPNKLSKCDSWHQICQLQNMPKPPSPKFNTSGSALRRSKSGHTLALPKLYEASYDRAEISEKQKTVAAYFGGQKSPNSLSRNSSQTNLAEESNYVSVKKSSINRIRTSDKASTSRQDPSSGLSRSHTMPQIANVNLLDESNVEDAFEQLMNGLSTTTTEKTQTKNEDGGVVTTTTKVTTRTISGAPKPVSPFAKFQQLDKQSSLQSPKSPITPTTPGGSSSTPIFRFTDPALNARAATFKEQLLQWCQSKTQEYENVQITNFSASWTDGLAFCALIHHFLPDAFDYSKLNPKQRRYNFELAFRVADEKAGIAPLLDVEDMVVMKRPDWKCVFTYVQSIYRRFRNCQ